MRSRNPGRLPATHGREQPQVDDAAREAFNVHGARCSSSGKRTLSARVLLSAESKTSRPPGRDAWIGRVAALIDALGVVIAYLDKEPSQHPLGGLTSPTRATA